MTCVRPFGRLRLASVNPEPVAVELAELLARCTACRPWAEQDEGPYHREMYADRRDVVEDREGVRLRLGIRLTGDDGEPRRDVAVEIWHCDALGRYSGFAPPNPSVVATAATAPRGEYRPGETFLRGRQPTDAAGMVEFHTIYPGWYPGRTVHVHVIVRNADAVLTTQLYFPDEITDVVLDSSPYAERPGRDTTNDTDEIFPIGGEPAVLDLEPAAEGHLAAVCLALPG